MLLNVVLGNMILVRGGNEMRDIICQRCGQLLNPQEVFCPTCGLKTKRTQNVWRPLWMCILCIITMLFTKASNNFARVRAWLWEWEYKSAASTSFKINFDYPDGIKLFFAITILLLLIAVIMFAVERYFYSMLFVVLYGICFVIGDYYQVQIHGFSYDDRLLCDIQEIYNGYLRWACDGLTDTIIITNILGTLVHILCVGMLLFSIGICTIDTTNPKKKYMTRVFDVLAAATTLFAVIVTVRDIVCKF